VVNLNAWGASYALNKCKAKVMDKPRSVVEPSKGLFRPDMERPAEHHVANMNCGNKSEVNVIVWNFNMENIENFFYSFAWY
jgi:hypothetical protein